MSDEPKPSAAFCNMIKLRVIFLFFFPVLFFSCQNEKTKKTDTSKVTFNDVAPVIYSRCSNCHRPGSAAPFDLISYEDVRSHLKTVQLSINERLMPPWPADTAYSRFRDEKAMTKEEIELVNRWIASGAEEGDPKLLPPPPSFTQGSSLGKPDMVLKFPKPFFIAGNNKDHFIMMKVPYELPSDTFIRAIEIVPDNDKLVHHINAHLVQYESGAKKSLDKGKYHVNTEVVDKRRAYAELDLQNDDGSYPLLTPSVTNFLPGVETAVYPHDIGGYVVKKQGVLLLDNIHYGPSPVDTTDNTTFNLFFSPRPPKRPTKEFIVGTSGISPVEPPLVIPPNEIKTFYSRFKVPFDISLLTVNPHMHLLGKIFKAYALKPNGDTIHLIHIPRWDFRWQYFYTFRKPIYLPQGTVIVSEGTFDNTAENPLNPFDPPRTVSEREGSMRTTDEMFQLICTYITYQPGDENLSLENEPKRP